MLKLNLRMLMIVSHNVSNVYTTVVFVHNAYMFPTACRTTDAHGLLVILQILMILGKRM